MALNHFDRIYRRAKRPHQQTEAAKISELQTNNPQEFWWKLKTLGPQVETRPFANGVRCKDGNIATDSVKIHKEVSDYFESLLNPQAQDNEFDETFYEDIVRDKEEMETTNASLLHTMVNL